MGKVKLTGEGGTESAPEETYPPEDKVPAEPARSGKKPLAARGSVWDPDASPPARTTSAARSTTVLTKSGVTQAMIDARENYRRRVRQLLISPGKVRGGKGTVSPLNIVGTGFGHKWSSGRPTGKMCVHVFVRSKAPEEQIHPDLLAPGGDSVKGEKVLFDVLEIGQPRIHGFQTPEKPAEFGASISTDLPGGLTGSYGCRVLRRTPDNPDGLMCILSNNHILANINQAERGVTPILQPGGADAWSASIQHTIGHLVDFVDLNFSESPSIPSAPNTVDAAVAITAPSVCAPRFHGSYQYDADPVDPAPGMTVFKEGRTTDFTQGTIFSLGFNLDSMPYPNGLFASFIDLMLIKATFGTPFSQNGDSGALINGLVGSVYQPVGMLLGGDGGLWTFAHPIQNVFDALDIEGVQYNPDE
jgi:hypothetical protein